MSAYNNSFKHNDEDHPFDAMKNGAPLAATSGAIFVPSTAIKGVVRYDDGLRQH